MVVARLAYGALRVHPGTETKNAPASDQLGGKIVLKGLVGNISQQFSFFPLILAFLHVE